MTEATAPVEHHRGSWASPVEFIMSCLNYAIGLGNVWRFPYLVYRNGGGAFLGPYIIMLFLIGLPIFFLELAIGQYAGLGPIEAFQRISPFFHGLGYCTLVVITLITVYYQVIVAWALFYIFNSFSYELGWGSCKHDFNSPRCYSNSANDECVAMSNGTDLGSLMTYYNRTCVKLSDVCGSRGMVAVNATHCGNGTVQESLKTILKRVLASEEFYNDYVLGRNKATWEDWGEFHWTLCLFLLISWIVLYACLARGVQSSGKAAYFTTIFPIVLLTVLLCRGASLDGAWEGVSYYITPRWETLLDANVWGDAASQVFYSFGIGCGSLITLSSYSKFSNNCHTDALIVSVANLGTAVFAGFAVFTVMGFLANQQGVAVTEVVDSGPGLAFIVYPEAILRMPAPQVWAVLFFFMLFILGLGSQFAGVQAITTALIDKWPQLRKKQWLVTMLSCLGCFILEIPMCYSGGVYMFTLLDWNTASWAILLIGFAEIIVVSWVYGCERFLENLSEMGIRFYRPIRAYWRFVWVFASPIISLAVFVFVMSQYVPAAYGTYKFPAWADVIGWLISISTLLPFPIFAVYRIIYGKEITTLSTMDESDDFLPEDDSVFEAIVNVTADVESDAIIDDSFSSIQEDEAYFNATSTPMCYKQGSTRRGRRADSPTSSALPVFPGAGHNSPPPLPPSAVDPHSPSTSTRSRTRSRTRCRTPPPIAPAVVDPGSSSMSTRSRTRSRTRCGTPPPIRSSIVDPDSPSMGTRSRTGSRTRCGTPPPIRPPVVDPDSPSMGTRSRAGSRTRAATPTRACPPSPSSLTRSRSRPAAVSSSDTVPVQSSSGLAKSSRIKCSECPESYANERTFKVHKKMHTMKRVFSKVAKPAQFMEKLPSLVSETLDLFLKEMHTGKHAEATRSFMADLKDALSTSEIEEFYEYLHKSLYDILVQHSSVFSSSLVYKFYVGVNVLMNQLEFKDNMKKLFVPCLKDNHQMEVINIGFGHFMHLLSSQVVIYFIRTIHGATAHDEIRRKRSNDSVDSTTFLEMCYYIGGSVVNALLFKAKKFKESNPNWEVFHDVINGRFRRVEGVGNACAPEVSHFTEAVDRGKLIHISQEALDFFVVLFDLLMSLEGRDGSLPVNVVEDNVLEDMSIICLWDVLIGTELDDTASLDFLIQTSTSCKLIVMKGIMKRRLNDNIKKAISSVSLRSRLAE